MDWLVDPRGIFLEDEVTERHLFLRVYLHIVFINIAMKRSLDEAFLRVKVDDDLGGIVKSHEESILARR